MIGFIYKIKSNTINKIYIGSTLETIEKRFKRHKSQCKGYINGRDAWRNAIPVCMLQDSSIELIKIVHIDCKDDLLKEEQKAMDENREHLINEKNAYNPNRRILNNHQKEANKLRMRINNALKYIALKHPASPDLYQTYINYKQQLNDIRKKINIDMNIDLIISEIIHIKYMVDRINQEERQLLEA